MRRVSTFRMLGILLAMSGAALLARDAVAQPELAESYWEADDDCFIVDLAFYSDGTVDIDYDNGDDDTGTWTLSGATLKIEFDGYEDVFVGSYSGDTIKAAHIWFEKEDDAPMTESCVYHRADDNQQNAPAVPHA